MQVINNNSNKSNYYVTNIVRLTSYKLFISTYAHSVNPCLLPRLYIPTILVVGLHGWLLSPLLIVVCDMFVYSEFMIHPIVLLVSSDTLRQDVWLNIVSNYQVMSPLVNNWIPKM